MITGLATVSGPCDGSLFQTEEHAYPMFFLTSFYGLAEPGASRRVTSWQEAESEAAPGPEEMGPASWSVEGATDTLAATAAPAIGKPYNCAFVSLGSSGSPEESGEVVLFPIAVPPPVEPPKPVEVVKTVTVTAPASAPASSAPARLAIAKPKALSAKAGKWVKASVKVTNEGGTAVARSRSRRAAPPGSSSSRARPSSLGASGPGLTAKGSLTVKLAG